MESVWFRGERPRKPRLSRERIVEAAVALLDAEGVEGFSMRALAARLRAGTMSLYEYVAGKEDVLDLALDAVLGEIEPAGPDEPWREALSGQLTRARAVMRRHPWVPALAATRPLVGPNALAGSERFYAALAQAGLSGPTLPAAVGALYFYAYGFVAAENTWWGTVRHPDQDAAIRARVQEHLREHAPALAAHAQVETDDFDAQFALGLRIILDGVEAALPS
ncbi:MAG TPA: TetR/AcrR family transcriptional regulator [Pseudonocardia sp.]|uniref:TetR/AcrR family transcriptional regulator n=1 Tax=Pseudonocardia sp. TaxID=60912 RepID=UPI002B4B7C36|nr:TetR/AcrR family transcriptional regulator [Pseudonocardia sp.]HLU59532.1 TetR/AcrR family transcriptional regulator [Pseudonocardia sp.]